jgi:hypothetical protein
LSEEELEFPNPVFLPPLHGRHKKFLENACDRFNKRKVIFEPAVQRPVSSPNMSPDGKTSNGNDDPNQVDPWIQAQLSTDQVHWLKRQGGVMSQAELLKNALAEWVVRHPDDWFRGTRLGDAIRCSLTEFIDRHKEEFLALE